jgi:hypothetical protein
MNTKINKVQAYFMTGNSLTVLDCFNLFKTFELRKIVCVLKSRGLKINSIWMENLETKSRYKKYFLIK